MENSNEPIGNRTRDLPACSAVPRPTARPRASIISSTAIKLIHYLIRISILGLAIIYQG